MRIGALAAAAGLTTKTIRFYEQAGLVPEPPRTSAGYRDYPPGAAARLAFIRDAQTAGPTLAGGGGRSCGGCADAAGAGEAGSGQWCEPAR